MPNHQLLDNITHKDVHVITTHAPQYGDNASYSHVFLDEFQHVQAHYPIFFHKNAGTGQLEAIALLGLAGEENLFVTDAGWQANYIPLSIQRRPFLIGFQESTENGVVSQSPVVHIDMDSPRVSYNQGEAVFLPQGGQSPYLQNISSILMAIHQGHEQTKLFIDTLQQHQLIESVEIKVTLDDGSNHSMDFLHTINEEKVAQLSAETVATLHQQGYLKAIYMILASMPNMADLIALKNRQLNNA
ncbi:SapC family protein [Alteromonadaceae bacterium BrNp21-10]|nr:SapC family protein [Alteromonadaceae bacterium BrNp21-10]